MVFAMLSRENGVWTKIVHDVDGTPLRPIIVQNLYYCF